MVSHPRCVLLVAEPELAVRLRAQGVEVVLAFDEDEAFVEIERHPTWPVLVDVAAFPQWAKRLRLREGAIGRPGAVIGFSSPLAADAGGTAEAFCDAMVTRPAVLRRPAEVLAGGPSQGPAGKP